MQRPPFKRNMYRFPWSMNDNPIGWLEVTDKCNTYCRGCYRRNMTGHKTLEQIKEEIDLLKEWRNCDNISIAGGEPLIHPEIMEILAYIRQRGIKPLILTNGIRLVDDEPFMRELKKAGAIGFTFHIDSEQNRPHWKGKNELELCDLRLEYARMVAKVGGMFVSFGSTIYPSNVHLVPKIVQWANEHIDIVNGLVFITFRGAPMDGMYNYFVDGQPVEVEVSYKTDDSTEIDITSRDLYAEIKKHYEHYEPSGYLGGTQTHDAIKWLIAVQMGAKGQMYGSLGAKAMEMVQAFHHMFKGTYLTYTPMNKLPKIAFLMGLLDKGLGRTHRNYWKDILRHPARFFQPVYIQSIGIVNAPDILPDGRQDMCDSCPDMTVWDGKLVHSCRMDEWRLYGTYVVAQPNVQEGQDAPKGTEVPVPDVAVNR